MFWVPGSIMAFTTLVVYMSCLRMWVPHQLLISWTSTCMACVCARVFVCVGCTEPYISSEQLVGHSSLWPALSVARMSPLAVS